jgi:hypothetical protein
MTGLVPTDRSDEGDLQALRDRVREGEATLHERRAELARLDTELAAFNIRYRHEVGRLHDELDALEAALAEAELGEIDRRLQDAGAAPNTATSAQAEAPPARFTSDAVRRLFRDVAKLIHPDLARDADGLDRRHALMVAANDAYAVGDAERLRAILQTWERSAKAVEGTDPAAMRQRLTARVAEIDAQLAECTATLAARRDSPLWKLKTMVDEAAAAGKDLVADMVRRLKRDILVTTNRLDAMRSYPAPAGPAAPGTPR